MKTANFQSFILNQTGVYVRNVCYKFCKDPPTSFWDVLLTKIDYTQTYRQTDRKKEPST